MNNLFIFIIMLTMTAIITSCGDNITLQTDKSFIDQFEHKNDENKMVDVHTLLINLKASDSSIMSRAILSLKDIASLDMPNEAKLAIVDAINHFLNNTSAKDYINGNEPFIAVEALEKLFKHSKNIVVQEAIIKAMSLYTLREDDWLAAKHGMLALVNLDKSDSRVPYTGPGVGDSFADLIETAIINIAGNSNQFLRLKKIEYLGNTVTRASPFPELQSQIIRTYAKEVASKDMLVRERAVGALSKVAGSGLSPELNVIIQDAILIGLTAEDRVHRQMTMDGLSQICQSNTNPDDKARMIDPVTSMLYDPSNIIRNRAEKILECLAKSDISNESKVKIEEAFLALRKK